MSKVLNALIYAAHMKFLCRHKHVRVTSILFIGLSLTWICTNKLSNSKIWVFEHFLGDVLRLRKILLLYFDRHPWKVCLHCWCWLEINTYSIETCMNALKKPNWKRKWDSFFFVQFLMNALVCMLVYSFISILYRLKWVSYFCSQ